MAEKDAWYKKVANAIIDAETFDVTKVLGDVTIYDLIGNHIIKDLDPVFQSAIDAGPKVKSCFDPALGHLRSIGVKVYVVIPAGQRNRVCVTTNPDHIVLGERAADLDYDREETKFTQAANNAANKILNQHQDKAALFIGSTQRCLQPITPSLPIAPLSAITS
jgi:hypothetical protein